MSPSRNFLPAFAVLLVGLSSSVDSFRQEMTMYISGGDYFHFENNYFNMASFVELLAQVERVCWRGVWYTFSEANFTSEIDGLGEVHNTDIQCFTGREVLAPKIRSIRHLGFNDTEDQVLSLYTGDNYFDGQEIPVTGDGMFQVQENVYSFAVTGASPWTLFEGTYLNGTSKCVRVLTEIGHFIEADLVSSIGLSKVGSVTKGCVV